MIWPFSSPPAASRPEIHLTDLHCHVLPGLDDGAVDAAQSLELLRGLHGLGFRNILATPHYNHYMFDNPTPAQLASGAASIEKEAAALELTLRYGAEIMLRDDFITAFSENIFPGIANTFLVEFAHRPGTIIPEFDQFIFDARVHKRTLLIAHPERHPDFHRRPDMLLRFKKSGALLQLDLLSLVSQPGSDTHTLAWRLVDEHLADVAATDVHRPKHLPRIEKAMNALASHDADAYIRLLSTNAEHIFNGEIEKIE